MTDTPNQTAEFTRAEVNKAAQRLANYLFRFMGEADQFISLARRCDLVAAKIALEDIANGR